MLQWIVKTAFALILIGFATVSPAHSGFARAAEFPPFIHPGLLQTRADLDRMRDQVAKGAEPRKIGFEALRANPQSQAGYVPHTPLVEVGRNPTIYQGEFDSDCNAAYQCALMWAITGDPAFAEKSRRILDGWASTLKTISGFDAILMAGLGPFKMVNAAEILRDTDPKWTAEETARCETLFRGVVYPVLKEFALFANGNWDTAAIKTVMAIGVFCDDRAMFERALLYYTNGAGDGRLTHYIYPSGQCQESGRDQAHAQLGLGHMGDCCEIAWNQGLDLYGLADNRLLKGFEYTAQYNLGNEVSYTPDLDRTGKYPHSVISTQSRGILRPLFEQIYNHYVNRMGITAPFTQQAAERIRPERAAQGADHPGFGTLLYSRVSATPAARPKSAPVTPGGLSARGEPAGVTLSWIGSIRATGYTVKRAVGASSRYAVLAANVKSPSYKDASVKPGSLYSYIVSASNPEGRSKDTSPVSACAGLPPSWSHQDIGAVSLPGAAESDGQTFTLEAAGTGIGGASDQCHFASVSLTGDGTITARVLPQVSCQLSAFGLMMRTGSAPDAPQVALLLTPQAVRSVETPEWHGVLVTRAAPGAEAVVSSSSPALSAPTVTYGRLKQPFWLRLERADGTFSASISTEGAAWTPLGRATLPLTGALQVGLFACSRKPQITTTVTFDHVKVSGR